MRLVILGAPNSGKEMHAQSLSKEHKIPWISPGTLLQDEHQEGDLPVCVSDESTLSNETIIKLLEARLCKRDCRRGFVICDFPSSIPQAQALDSLLGMLGKPLQVVVHIKVDEETLEEHVVGCLECSYCKTIYNRDAMPQVRGKCNYCRNKLVLIGRNAKTTNAFIAAIEAEIVALNAYYKAQHKLRTVSSIGKAEEVRRKLGEIVDIEIRPLEITTIQTVSTIVDEGAGTIIAGGQIKRLSAVSKKKVAKKTRPRKTIDTSQRNPPKKEK